MNFPDFWSIHPFFTNTTIRYLGCPTNIDKKYPIYRARYFEDFELNEKNLRYPDKENCKKTGRANIPYHPVFYGSLNPECAISEILDPKRSIQKFVLSKWIWDQDSEISCVLFSNRDPESELAFKKYNIRTLEEYIEKAIQLKRDVRPGSMFGNMLEVICQISDLFLNEYDYFGTSIVSYDHLYRTRINKNINPIDALLYLSCKNKNEINIAIHPKIVDKHLKMVEVIVIDR